MSDERQILKMSKGLGLASQELLAVPQTNEVWEADFVPLSPRCADSPRANGWGLW